MEGMNMYAAADPKFPEDRFRRYLEVYSRAGGRLTWPEAQAEVDRELAAPREPLYYERELLPDGGEMLFESGALQYAIDSNTPLPRLGPGGYVIDEDTPRVDYFRAPKHAPLTPQELNELAVWLDATEAEAKHFWDEVLDGIRIRGESWSTAQDKAMAATFGPRPRPPRRQDARESATQTAATRQTVAGVTDSSGITSFLTPAADPWGPGHATKAPVQHGDGSTSRTTESSRRRQGIPRPAPGERGQVPPVPGRPAAYERDLAEVADLTDQEHADVIAYLESNPTATYRKALSCVISKRRAGAKLATERTKVPSGAPVGRPAGEPVRHQRGGDGYEDEPFETFAARFACPGLRVVSRRVRGCILEPVYERL
jgi:hypothetical protein